MVGCIWIRVFTIIWYGHHHAHDSLDIDGNGLFSIANCLRRLSRVVVGLRPPAQVDDLGLGSSILDLVLRGGRSSYPDSLSDSARSASWHWPISPLALFRIRLCARSSMRGPNCNRDAFLRCGSVFSRRIACPKSAEELSVGKDNPVLGKLRARNYFFNWLRSDGSRSVPTGMASTDKAICAIRRRRHQMVHGHGCADARSRWRITNLLRRLVA